MVFDPGALHTGHGTPSSSPSKRSSAPCRRSPRWSILAGPLLAVMATLALASSALAASADYDAAVSASTPLAYWRLDGASTTSVPDSSGHGYTLTGAGSVTAGVTGPMAGSTGMSFNGGTLSRSYFSYNNNFAIEARARSNRVAEREAIVSNGLGGLRQLLARRSARTGELDADRGL